MEDAADARALAAEIKERAARLRLTPGLLDGALEEVRGAIEKVLREYDKLSRRRLGAFERDLDVVARRAQELEDAGRLSPRHARLMDQALLHTRRVHFWNARRVLGKLDKALEPAREWQKAVDAYRAFHRKVTLRVREAEDALQRLRSVPRPAVSPEEVARARASVEACNRAADAAWTAQTTRPLTEALKDLVAHPDVEGLGLLSVQEFSCLRELSDLLEAQADLGGGIGLRPLTHLVSTSEYSAAKWDRVFPQAAHARRKLQDLFHQLRPVVGGRYGTAVELVAPVPVLERRLAAWRRFPGADASPAWEDLAGLIASGRVASIQESARAYERVGDLAKRAFTGALAGEIKEQETELAAARKTLEKLPSPDSFSG